MYLQHLCAVPLQCYTQNGIKFLEADNNLHDQIAKAVCKDLAQVVRSVWVEFKCMCILRVQSYISGPDKFNEMTNERRFGFKTYIYYNYKKPDHLLGAVDQYY